MNISSEIFPTDGLNFSDVFFHNSTEEETSFAVITVDIIIVLLDFPINIYVIWLIVRGTGNGLAAEFFSFNLTACEMLFCIQCLLNLINYKFIDLWTAELLFYSLGIMGCPLFQCLMCVERYLAVVHPVIFLKYKPLRYRVICCVIAWVATFVFSGIRVGTFDLALDYFSSVFILVQFSLLLFIQLFCLVAVLRALKQSGPGETARKRKEENHMKKRAFLIILITSLTTLIKFLPHIVLMAISFSIDNTETAVCIGYVCFTFAGLVQSLLFLNRVGKIPFIKCH